MQNKGLMGQIGSRNMLICMFTGFSSGFPLYVLISLLPVWFRQEGVALKTIGFFTLITLPFTWKFLWSPFVDYYQFPFLGRRRGWMLITQLLLMILLMMLGFFHPQNSLSLYIIAFLATLIAFCSATQDIVLDAFRREILSDRELGLGNAIHVNTYRFSSLVAGGLLLILADHYTWQTIFLMAGFFMLPALFLTLVLSKEQSLTGLVPKNTLKASIIEPFNEFFTRKGRKDALIILGFMFLYKLGDSLATALISPFYLDMGFSPTQIGLVVKNVSLWSMILASLAGGVLMLKIGINKALWLFGIVQVVSILGFVWLAHFGHFNEVGYRELWILAGVVAGEYIGVGLGTSAFVAFMARETSPLYSATQFALFTSFSALPRATLNSFAGVWIENLGYYHYFWLCFFLAILGVGCLYWVAPWKRTN